MAENIYRVHDTSAEEMPSNISTWRCYYSELFIFEDLQA